MVKQVELFETNDGKKFPTMAEAEAHEAGQVHTGLIEAYITSAGLQKAQAGLMRKHLASFIVFEASYVAPAPAETPAEQPATT
jgi:hypothetical protein